LTSALLLSGGLGCKRKQKPAEAPPAAAPAAAGPGAPPGGGVKCPPTNVLARAVHAGNAVADCEVLGMGYYWMGVVLAYDATPALTLLSGGLSGQTLAYALEPAPTEAIARLVRDFPSVSVSLRSSPSDRSLVRVGVRGAKSPDANAPAEEIVVLLQLVAHAPPKIMWEGEGNQVTVRPDGCVIERGVDFSMAFGRRIQLVTSQKARPAEPAGPLPADCVAGPWFQESISPKGLALKDGRPLELPK
jgi:hypothetical protein